MKKKNDILQEFRSTDKCEYRNCKNLATGKCGGSQECTWFPDKDNQHFLGECEKYFCQDHLKWGWGLPCVNCCTANQQCPDHHTGIFCNIL